MDLYDIESYGAWTTKNIVRPWLIQKVAGGVCGDARLRPKRGAIGDAAVAQWPRFLQTAYGGAVAGAKVMGAAPPRIPEGPPVRALHQDTERHIAEAKLGAAIRGLTQKVSIAQLRRAAARETLERSADRGAEAEKAACRVQAGEPVELPESLKAKIVDPRSFEDIPIIDLSRDDATVLEQMRYACEVVGFMQVVGHGVSAELQQRHLDLQRRFFELSSGVKSRLTLDEASPVRGYFGKGGEDLDQVLERQVDEFDTKPIRRQRADHKEAFDMNGVPWSKPAGGFVADIFGMPSRVPTEEELPGFKETMEEYAQEMFALSKRVLSLMARILGKHPDFFEQYLTAPVATHRLLHYWPIEDYSSQIGVGEHTDYGLLTVLRQDRVGGLQVLDARELRWVHCVPVENAFVINLGDMMSRWTGYRFKSTIHRVVNTANQERFSTPYFLEPNMDTVIAHGALCGGGDGGAGEGGSVAEPGLPSATAEDILGRFYRASGQLKARGAGSN